MTLFQSILIFSRRSITLLLELASFTYKINLQNKTSPDNSNWYQVFDTPLTWIIKFNFNICITNYFQHINNKYYAKIPLLQRTIYRGF
jgi:hypothetical protein